MHASWRWMLLPLTGLFVSAATTAPAQQQGSLPSDPLQAPSDSSVDLSTPQSTAWDPILFAPNLFGDIPRTPVFCLQTPDTPGNVFSFGQLIRDGNLNPLTYESFAGFTHDASPGYVLPASWFGFAFGSSVDQLTTTIASDINTSIGDQLPLVEDPGFIPAADFVAPAGHTFAFDPANSYLVMISDGGSEIPDVYHAFLTYIFTAPDIPGVCIYAPNPIDGGLVGRQKVSTDNNPLPRDRFILQYDYLDQAQLTRAGVDINRLVLGFEKTFADGNASLDVRIPFASTLDSHFVDGAQGTATELGNLQLIPKFIIARSSASVLSTGLGISIPTADDVVVSNAAGQSLFEIQNDSVVLKPFLAGLWTPTESWFVQSWVQASFDTTGNPVSLTPANAGLTQVGILNDATVLSFDAQLGYWWKHPAYNQDWLRGLAPFLELHFNTTVQDTDTITYNNIFIHDLAGRTDELNMTTGLISQLGDNWNLSIGVTLPLRDQYDRFSDWNVGFRLNRFFGATAANRSALSAPSSF